jgi:hypothetical protein
MKFIGYEIIGTKGEIKNKEKSRDFYLFRDRRPPCEALIRNSVIQTIISKIYPY